MSEVEPSTGEAAVFWKSRLERNQPVACSL